MSAHSIIAITIGVAMFILWVCVSVALAMEACIEGERDFRSYAVICLWPICAVWWFGGDALAIARLRWRSS